MEIRDDQGRKDDAGQKRVLIPPDLGPCARKQRVDKGQKGIETDQGCRRLPRLFDMARTDAVDPACIQVQEVEDDVADVRDDQRVEVACNVRRQCQQDRSAKIQGEPLQPTGPKTSLRTMGTRSKNICLERIKYSC